MSNSGFTLFLAVVSMATLWLCLQLYRHARRVESRSVDAAARMASEQSQGEQSRREIADRLETTLESITDAFYIVDPALRFTYVNAAAERLIQRERSDLLGRYILDVFRSEPGNVAVAELLKRAVTTMTVTHSEAVHPVTGRWYETCVYPSPLGAAVYLRDVTDRRRAVTALRLFAQRTESVQDEERAAIARELHDDIGQALTALRMDVSWLNHHLVDEADSRRVVAGMIALIDATLSSTRSLAMSMHPIALDDIGLTAAIEIHLGHTARRARLSVTRDLQEVEAYVDRAQAKAIYRVLQESLTNIVRHADATEVTVTLAATDGELLFAVADNGRGIDSGKLDNPGLGLVGMHERAAALDGTLTISRVHPHGTDVRLRLPLATIAADTARP